MSVLSEDTLLLLVDSLSAGLRHGADSRAVLYAWRRCGGADRAFRNAVASLLAQQRLRILDGPGKSLALTVAGLERLRELPPATPSADAEAEAVATVPEPRPGQPLPRHAPDEALMRMLAVIALPLPPGTAVAATTLATLWAWERLRAADLRRAIEQLKDRDLLRVVHEGARTAVVATEAGHAALAEFGG